VADAEIYENFPASATLPQQRMSEGRKPVWVALWIQRLFSAFSRLAHLRQFAVEDLCNSLILLARAVSDAKM
jgi:hypothetical protein